MTELILSDMGTAAVSLLCWAAGCFVSRKAKNHPAANPLLIATVILGCGLMAAGISPAEFYENAGLVNFWIVPATAVLGLAIWRNLARIKENLIPVLGGCMVGAFTALVTVLGLCKAFGLDAQLTASLAPKSVTNAIATAVSAQYGGIVPITIFSVMITGIMGGVMAPGLIRLFKVRDQLEAGLATGASSHAVGTSVAVKLGEVQGALSGVAMSLCGVFTVLFALALPWVLAVFFA